MERWIYTFKRSCLFLLISFCLPLRLSAQYEYLLHKTYAARVKPLFLFYTDTLSHADSVTIFRKINSIEELATKNGDNDLLLETQVMKAHYYYYRQSFPASKVLPMIEDLKAEGIKQHKPWLQAVAEHMTAFYYFYSQQNYEIGFEHFNRAYLLFRDLSPADFPLKQDYLVQLGDAHYFFADYQEAIRYDIEALAADPSIQLHDLPTRVKALNTLGLCYQQLKQFDSSNYYFEQTRAAARKINSIAWQGIAGGNLGYNFFLKKDYAQAIPLLEEDVQAAIANYDYGLASGSLMVLGDISLLKKDVAAADAYLKQARAFVYQSGQYKRLEQLYPLLAKLAAIQNHGADATIFIDSALIVRDSLAHTYNALHALRAKQKVDLEQYYAEIDRIRSRKKIDMLERNILIALVVLLMAGSVYMYRKQLRKYSLKQQQAEQAKQELAVASKQLSDFARNISEKNQLIEILEEEKSSKSQDILQQLQQSTILTGNDWEYFRQLLEKVHAGFFQRLKEKVPGLTPAETRFMALGKLKLSNKEMAAMLGIGTDAIRQYRSRIRKKLHIGEEDNLDDLIDRI